MKKLTEEQKREILSSLTKIQQVAEDFQVIVKQEYGPKNHSPFFIFYQQFSNEVASHLFDIHNIYQEGGAQ